MITSTIDDKVPEYWKDYLVQVRKYDPDAHNSPRETLRPGCYQKIRGDLHLCGADLIFRSTWKVNNGIDIQ